MEHTLYERLLSAPESSFFLFGARGVGKSTWVHHTGIPFHEIDLLEEDLYQRYLPRPELFRSEINALKPGSWVFVDEIQRIPGLLNEVHRAIEKQKLKFILSGSSARRIVRGGANLLAGRALIRHLFPLTPAEMGRDFHL